MAAAGVATLVLAGSGGGPSASAGSPPPPTPADFVSDPTCMVYATGADLRLRVRASDAAAACKKLSGEPAAAGSRWSLQSRRARQILSPICLFADPRGRIELEVIDDAAGARRGGQICAGLARAGWFDLRAP
jgi:hypothetical protein